MKLEKLDSYFTRQIRHMLYFLIGVIIVNKVSAGGGIVLLIGLSTYFALSKKIGMFMVTYMMIPFLTEMNGQLIGTGILFRYGARVAVLSSVILLLLQYCSSKGRYVLPIGGIFLFLLSATISSIDGYCPQISYMKIINYGLFMLGLYFGGRMISEDIAETSRMRAAILAFAIFLVFGSILLFLKPSLGYMSMENFIEQGYTEKQIAEQLVSGDVNLYRGVCNHSQTLAVLLVTFVGWVACDMFFVEQRLTKLHCAIIGASLPLFHKTGSRTALIGFVTLCFILVFFSIPRAKLPLNVKHRIKGFMSAGVAILIVVAAIMQLSAGGISKWLRKADVNSDDRGLVEAITSTRMGLVELNMADFNKNRLLGVGFQVNEDSVKHLRAQGSFVISAPIERGVLPLAILAEGGILGAISFIIFLIIFYGGCFRQGFVATMTLFTVYLELNFSEMTFFSPNGGGTQWVILLIGGFVVDITSRAKWKQHLFYSSYASNF